MSDVCTHMQQVSKKSKQHNLTYLDTVIFLPKACQSGKFLILMPVVLGCDHYKDK